MGRAAPHAPLGQILFKLNRMAALYLQHTGQPTLPPAQWLREYLHTHPDDIRHDTRLTLVR